MELINVTIHGDGKSKPQEVKKVYCKAKDSCSLYAKGKCVMLGILSSTRCEQGKIQYEKGFTKRSASQSSFNSKIRSMPEYGKLNFANDNAYVAAGNLYITSSLIEHRFLDEDELEVGSRLYNTVGDVMITTCWNADSYNFKGKTRYFKKGFTYPIDKLTPEIIDKIYSLEPRTLFEGTVIKSYESEVLRDLDIILSQYRPDLRSVELNYVGKEALLITMNPGKVRIHDNLFLDWDGEFLIDNSHKNLPIWATFRSTDISEVAMKFKPNDKFKVTITSNDQINEHTVIL